MPLRLPRQNQLALVGYFNPATRVKFDTLGGQLGKGHPPRSTVMCACPSRLLLVILGTFRKMGGHIIGIMPIDDDVEDTSSFDAVISVKDPDDALVIACSSCSGIIAIPTDDDSAYRKDALDKCKIPVAVLTDTKGTVHEQPEEAHQFSNAQEASMWIYQTYAQTNRLNARDLLQSALDIRKRNYPHGADGCYLAAAERFRASMASASEDDQATKRVALAFFLEALADHAYYHERDFFGAACLYDQAWQELYRPLPGKTIDVKKLAYLRAITIESVALAFAKSSEMKLAYTMALEAIVCYQHASHYASADTLSCYRHTVAGLMGWAHLMQADAELAAGRIDLAEAALGSANKQYAEALREQPLWETSGFSDQYINSVEEVKAVEKKIHQAKELNQ